MIKSSVFDETIISHGFFTRQKGVSSGIYASLNCGAGSDDNPEHVLENKKIAANSLGLDLTNLATLYQVHSSTVITITDPEQIEERPQADAFVTSLPTIALGILTADCVPILFADPVNRVIGAAHSGWKGTVSNITSNTVMAMEALGAKRDRIVAAIGPAIQQASYEVGPDFPDPFLAINPDNKEFFIPSDREKHHMFDLTGYVYMQLENLGLARIEKIDRDTCKEEDLFYSYRRMCKRGEKDYGRQLSAIALTG
ncbi:MAG: peptidoglycan editing factor PgeF [Sneathiellales bacterium]|nr:peptidoglycan editing factor PgeF [Sneathiellales bacterium]